MKCGVDSSEPSCNTPTTSRFQIRCCFGLARPISAKTGPDTTALLFRRLQVKESQPPSKMNLWDDVMINNFPKLQGAFPSVRNESFVQPLNQLSTIGTLLKVLEIGCDLMSMHPNCPGKQWI